MPGHRSSFTRTELNEISSLLDHVRRSDRSQQKSLRARIRKFGFYISDFATNQAGFTSTDLDRLVRSGIIKVTNEPELIEHPAPRRVVLGAVSPTTPPGATGSNTPSAAVEGWTRVSLEQAGFRGWLPWSSCPSGLQAIHPTAGGVYLVYREGPPEPTYLDHSPAGTFRGNPSLTRAALAANWVPGARVVYIGKANHGRLKDRLKEFVGFGRGGRHRHWGGRLIWQLDLSESLLVAWRVLARDLDPGKIEEAMIAAFRSQYGKPPFANDPHLLGR